MFQCSGIIRSSLLVRIRRQWFLNIDMDINTPWKRLMSQNKTRRRQQKMSAREWKKTDLYWLDVNNPRTSPTNRFYACCFLSLYLFYFVCVFDVLRQILSLYPSSCRKSVSNKTNNAFIVVFMAKERSHWNVLKLRISSSLLPILEIAIPMFVIVWC